MAVAVEVPKLGNTVEECLISQWRKQKGDAVAAGEVVAEIETDKASFEVTAPSDGTLLETFFEPGALVPVFTNLFVIGKPGEDVEQFRPQSGAPAPVKAADTAGETPAPAAQHQQAGPAAAAAQGGSLSPRARKFAEEHGAAGMPLPPGSGPGGRILEEDLRRQHYSSPRISSVARARLQEGAEVQGPGSGVGGMILSSDVGAPVAKPISSIREKIARRMRESLVSTAQYTLHSSANAAGLLLVRAKVKASGGKADININDLVTWCTVQALKEVPALNAEFIDGRIHQHSAVHIGFACDTPRGLMVPVVRDAHNMSAAELSTHMKELTAQALAGTIGVDNLSGATFTVSNLGNMGIESFTPLLNPPQVAILGVDAIGLKPVRRESRIEFIDSIGLSITLDHQVIDGAPGARFLKTVREKIENVESLCTI
jgi:pyruvate dehydrogenase E2 component (dihydrolipoamide acetyltransferase)